ncbi:MAG: DUF1152 domain-containing protein [Staphylothermus sp.]|nr:DUF1152 domain-containing protein [Staphylothermus sp.]
MINVFDKKDQILVIGIGGGGDVISAAMLAYALRRVGYKTGIAAIVWERFVYDPIPGPVKLEELINLVEKQDYYAVINGETIAKRGDKYIEFQAANVSKALNENIVVLDLWRGVKGLVKGINKVIQNKGYTKVIGVDVGGDVLAEGAEENLWSPLADSMCLAALKHIPDSLLIVHSPGSDGELGQEYVLKRISMVAARKGYIGAYGMTREDAELLEKILKYAKSEASMMGLLAFKGFHGYKPIRLGTRKVLVNIIHTISFIMKADTVYQLSKPAQLVDNTQSLEEANTILNKHGIYTEYNLEIDLIRNGLMNKREINYNDVLKIRKLGKEKLQRMMTDQSTDHE